jgi:parvulin-like peptidyl-prolyl isomerase
VTLNAAEFAKSANISSEEIAKNMADQNFAKKVEEYYKTNEASYESKEQVKASHILIKADPTNDAAAKAKAEAVLKRVQKEDFGKVAAEVSDDPGSKVKKGDLGYFGHGQMVPEFEKVAFELPVGKISGLVKSNFGYHIIKVTDKKAASKSSFESVKNEIAKKFLAEERYLTFIKSIEAKLSEGKIDEVNSMIAQAKLGWKETGYFDIGADVAPGMNSAQALKAAVTLTKAQPYSKKLVREGDTQFLIKLKDSKTEPAELKQTEESNLERQKSSAAYAAWVDSFRKTARIQTNSSLTRVDK